MFVLYFNIKQNVNYILHLHFQTVTFFVLHFTFLLSLILATHMQGLIYCVHIRHLFPAKGYVQMCVFS